MFANSGNYPYVSGEENVKQFDEKGLRNCFGLFECYINCYLGAHFAPNLAWPLMDFTLWNEHFLGTWTFARSYNEDYPLGPGDNLGCGRYSKYDCEMKSSFSWFKSLKDLQPFGLQNRHPNNSQCNTRAEHERDVHPAERVLLPRRVLAVEVRCDNLE